MIRDIQDEIIKLKREKNVCILAHSYQAHEILEIADFSGDSYALSLKAADCEADTVIMCGVRFMAETVKILSPQKRVILANPDAGCAMADMMDKQLISQIKEKYPDYTVVAYLNTTADLKTICDVCVTSSSAVKIVNNIENKNILFIPDENLGAYVAQQLPDKNIKLLSGCCPIHAAVTVLDVERAREKHPGAKLLVHPECSPQVAQKADFVGSTAEIMDYARRLDDTDFIIGTEMAITSHLQYEMPQKNFYNLTSSLVCKNMKLTTLVDVYNCMAKNGGEEINLDDETIKGARRCIDEMIRLSH